MKLPFETDQGASSHAALGLIVLQSDETIENEIRPLFIQNGLALYHSRIPSSPEVTSETLAEMKEQLPRAASLLPTVRPLDVVAYACTSGATIIGPDNITAAINHHHPKAKVTNPITAVMAALTHLGAKKIGLLTPYVAEVSTAMRSLLEQNGFKIAGFGSYEQGEDAVVARISTSSTYDAICQLAQQDDVEAVFASCTSLRSFDIINQAEKETGKPVITSNQALSWHMLKLAKPPIWPKGPGRLFSDNFI